MRFSGLHSAALGLLACAFALAAPSEAAADLYRFVDEDGGIHYSNVPNDPRYRRVSSRRRIASWRPRTSHEFDSLIRSEANRWGLPPALVKAVIAAESNFNPKARSPKGAQGLMQLMPGTAQAMGVENALRAEENVHGGSRYLARLVARYGDWTRALAAYNAGPKSVDRYRGVPPYPETREYVERVLTYYRRYHADFAR